ncbi:MAG: LolA-like outer membrane lipoprotein chaperone [Sulfurimonas sp.]|uniref:LolA-like outer membrane lipoprotein chaperone n=1 Tax=Sulfurimonas sp. TaxID=2022749 RepID=UPI002633F0FE|nr:LolA-like outer membrane lipoprotein chaperone [Sulfurimonas sp.]MDD5372188.1 LolA-like outer membrane lipoprotein chaperone [Sulfurimonas sp.]
MKYFFLAILISLELFASLDGITSFEADFTQSITDDKNKTLVYSGHIVALKPQNAKWSYIKPVKKDVFINDFEVTIVEPEIEQVIVKTLESNFDFFKIISNAKKIEENKYLANYKNSKFTITKNGSFIESISYLDEFENRVKISFKNQKQNQTVNKTVFTPVFPLNFDIIRD